MDDEKAEGDGGGQDRGGDQRGAQLAEEQQHDQPGKRDGDEEHLLRVLVVQRHVERLVEDRIELEPGVFVLEEAREILGVLCDRQIISLRLGLDTKPDRRLAVVEEIAILGRHGVLDLGDIGEVDDLAAEPAHGKLRQAGEDRVLAKLVRDADLDLPVTVDQRAAAAVEIGGIDRRADFEDREIIGGELVAVGDDLNLSVRPAEGGGGEHPGNFLELGQKNVVQELLQP